MNDELLTQIEAARKLLAEITDGPFAENLSSTSSLMDCIFKIGLAIERRPELHESEPVKSLIREMESKVDRLLLAVRLYILRVSNVLTSNWEDEEWHQVCKRRSAIEFLRKLLSLPETEELLDTEEVDDLIRGRGQAEGGLAESAIDSAIPSSHWWWWYPNQPPGH